MGRAEILDRAMSRVQIRRVTRASVMSRLAACFDCIVFEVRLQSDTHRSRRRYVTHRKSNWICCELSEVYVSGFGNCERGEAQACPHYKMTMLRRLLSKPYVNDL